MVIDELNRRATYAEGKWAELEKELAATKAALAASQADLTESLGRTVDLLYIIDAFQIESGAGREASYAAGIEAVKGLRTDRDLARSELASARQELEHLRAAAAERDEALMREWAENANLRARLARVPVADDEVLAWVRRHGIRISTGLAAVFSAVRHDLGIPSEQESRP